MSVVSYLKDSRLGTCCASLMLPVKVRLDDSPLAKRLASGAFWSLLASVGSRSFALLASIIMARWLGKAAFGEFGIILSTLDMFGTMAGFGMGLTSTKFVAECRGHDREKAGRIIAISSATAWVFGILAGLGLFMLAHWLANNVLAAPQLTSLLRISSVSLLLSAVSGAQMGVLVGFEAFRKIAGVSLVSGLMIFVFRVSGTLFLDLSGAVYGMIAAQAAGCVVTFAVLRQVAGESGVPLRYQHCMKELPMLWTFSLPSVLSSLTVMPVMWICSAMLVNQPNGYEELGIFTAANQWLTIILFAPAIISQAAMPVLSDRIGSGDEDQSAKIVLMLVKISALVLLPVVVIGGLSKVIMGCYGSGFASGWPVMVISVVTAGVMAVQTPVAYMFAAKGRMWTWLLMSAAMGLCFIGLNVWMVQSGALGMALARFVATCLQCAWSFAYLFCSLNKPLVPACADIGMAVLGSERGSSS